MDRIFHTYLKKGEKNMSVKYSHKEIDKIYWKTLLLALVCAVVSILLGCMLLSTLLISEVVDIKHLDIGAAAVLFVASITASLLMKKRIGEESKGVILICIGILTGTLLLLNSIIPGWEVNKVPLKIGALVVGGCVMMLESKGKNKKKKRRRN
jgi:hypothetical protein